MAQRVSGVSRSQISWHSALEGCEVVSLTHRPHLPQKMILVLIFTRRLSQPQGYGTIGRNMSLKNPVTPPGIDPRTVRLVVCNLIKFKFEIITLRVAAGFHCRGRPQTIQLIEM